MTDGPTIAGTGSTTGVGSEDDDPHIADVPGLFAEGTFVLVGCGSSKRDPEDPVDVHEAPVGPDEQLGQAWQDKTGPAWEAQDLYTSTYFGVKRELARAITQWARDRDGWPWAIVSAEHGIVHPEQLLTPYDTTIDDLGDDWQTDAHLADSPYRFRPDGKELVTELDAWIRKVAVQLQRWLTMFDDGGVTRAGDGVARQVIVLAGQDYVEPLRERGAFNGLKHLQGSHDGLDLDVRYLFEEIDAEGIGEQMAWMSDAVDTIEERRQDTEQVTLA